MNRPLIGIISLLLLSGCANPGATGPSPGPTISDSTSPSALSGGNESVVVQPVRNENRIRLDGCTAGLGTVMYVPADIYPHAGPAEWALDWPVLGLAIWLERCERISVGPFERGPIHVMMETHDNVDRPPSCDEATGDHDVSGMLSQIWVDDPFVVAHLRDQLGMPAHFMQANFTETDVGGQNYAKWTFGLPGEEFSNLEAVNGNADRNGSSTIRLYYFPTGDQVSFIDYSRNLYSEGFGNELVTGKLATPLLYATIGTGDAVGYGGLHEDAYFSGEVHRFRDRLCKEPL